MNAAAREAMNRIREAHRGGAALALLFDYDGTLTPIVEHPRLAALDDAVRRLLAALAARPRVRVGVLSGRELEDLKSLVALPGLYYAGTGGLELDLRGLHIVHPHADRAAELIARLAEALECRLAAFEGTWLEKKRLALTVHYRHAPEEARRRLRAAVADAVDPWAEQVRIVPGPEAWEITPLNRWNKGTAVRLILADSDADDELLFYAGDGANDAEAISEVAAMGGITLGIGPDAPPDAVCRLPDQAALMEFLSELNAALESNDVPDGSRKEFLLREGS